MYSISTRNTVSPAKARWDRWKDLPAWSMGHSGRNMTRKCYVQVDQKRTAVKDTKGGKIWARADQPKVVHSVVRNRPRPVRAPTTRCGVANSDSTRGQWAVRPRPGTWVSVGLTFRRSTRPVATQTLPRWGCGRARDEQGQSIMADFLDGKFKYGQPCCSYGQTVAALACGMAKTVSGWPTSVWACRRIEGLA